MKIKEAARCCGLTEKAIRLYESKGLIRPATAENNGRTFREYDQKCIRDLMTVGILRRAEFSLEQIGAMQSDCGKIPEILEENLHKLDMNVEHMTAVQAALVGCEGRARNIDELADAIYAALGGAASTDCDAPVQIRWRVWDEDMTAEQKQEAYRQFTEKQRKKERTEDILMAAPRRIGSLLGCAWSRLKGGIVNDRGRIRGSVMLAIIFLLVVIVMGSNLAGTKMRMAEIERGCVNAIFSSVRELDYLLTNVEDSGEYTHDDSSRACLIVTQLTDAIACAEGICGESVNMTRRNDLAGLVGSFLQVSVNGRRIEGILYDGIFDEHEKEFLRRLHADAVTITQNVTAEDGLNIRYRAKYKDIREGARAFVDKWCDISLDEDCPYVDIVKN